LKDICVNLQCGTQITQFGLIFTFSLDLISFENDQMKFRFSDGYHIKANKVYYK